MEKSGLKTTVVRTSGPVGLDREGGLDGSGSLLGLLNVQRFIPEMGRHEEQVWVVGLIVRGGFMQTVLLGCDPRKKLVRM